MKALELEGSDAPRTTSGIGKSADGNALSGESSSDTYRFPFSEIEALGEILETRRQMFYNTPHPSCAFYVIAEEAYCCLRGFTRHLGDLP